MVKMKTNKNPQNPYVNNLEYTLSLLNLEKLKEKRIYSALK